MIVDNENNFQLLVIVITKMFNFLIKQFLEWFSLHFLKLIFST